MERRRLHDLTVLAAAVMLGALFTANAWVGEDAHITMRTVDNFVNGSGLRWNIDERVQINTHPLWMLAVVPAYFVTREIPTTLTVIGVACSVGAFVVLARRLAPRSWTALGSVMLLFTASFSLLRYSTSGFENPLTFLLLGLYSTTVVRHDPERVPWGRLSLFAGLLTLNRLDTCLLVAPSLAVLVLSNLGAVRWKRVILGALPVALWAVFALLYFGFVTPNVAFAKLSTSFTRSQYLSAGAAYLSDLALSDPLGATVIILGALVTVSSLMPAARGDREARLVVGLGLGALTYVGYVVWIGGDFLSGRFLSAPILLSLVVCVARARAVYSGIASLAPGLRVACALGVLLLLATLRSAADVVVERADTTVLTRPAAHIYLEGGSWQQTSRARQFQRKGRDARARAKADGRRTAILSLVGIGGIEAGRDVILIDRFALTEPFLARLPAAKPDTLRPGHVVRAIPAGYLEARETGDASGMDPALAEYWEKLRLVTSGSLFDPERLRAIVGFHTGRYEHLLEASAPRTAR